MDSNPFDNCRWAANKSWEHMLSEAPHWLAQDSDGWLIAYKTKPVRMTHSYVTDVSSMDTGLLLAKLTSTVFWNNDVVVFVDYTTLR